jgi:hypothetical protein
MDLDGPGATSCQTEQFFGFQSTINSLISFAGFSAASGCRDQSRTRTGPGSGNYCESGCRTGYRTGYRTECRSGSRNNCGTHCRRDFRRRFCCRINGCFCRFRR